MAQIPLYLPDPVARRLARQAEAQGVSVSRLLAELVHREIPDGWPEGFFEPSAGREAEARAEGLPENRLRDDL